MKKIKTAIFGTLLSLTSGAAARDLVGVVNKTEGTISLIEVKTGQITKVQVGYLPHEIAFAPGYAYVSNYGSAHIRSSHLQNKPGNTISVIDLQSMRHTGEIDLGPARCAPHGLFTSKNGKRLYVTCEGRQEIAVVDLEKQKIAHFISTNQAGTHLLVVSADESRAYATNFWHGTVSVIDLNQRVLLKQISVGRGCEGIALSVDDRSLFVTRVEENEILKIDTTTLEIVHRRTVADGSSPIRVVSVPAHPKQVLVNNVGTGVLSILSSEDLSPIQEIKVGKQPIGLVAAESGYGFVANMKDNTLSVVNLKSGLVEKQFSTGKAPDGIAYMP